MSLILLVGGADTGRAPMAAALLRQQIAQHSLNWAVESAGVLGHDDSPPETEARDTMAHLGLDISEHRARLLSDELAASADLLIAVDGGTARVLRVRFPAVAARSHSLGALAGRQRDIPDPFRMQIGAWLTYARELDNLLAAALPRLRDLLEEDLPTVAPAAQPPVERAIAVAQLARLLQLAQDMPGVVDWRAARAQIEAGLEQASQPAGSPDFAGPYAAVLRAALAVLPAAPNAAQLAALRTAVERLAEPIDQPALAQLSAQVAALPTL